MIPRRHHRYTVSDVVLLIHERAQDERLLPPCTTGYFCKCPASFMGTHCEIGISPCASNPCLYGGTCVPRADDFYCQCRGQYSGQRYHSFLFFFVVVVNRTSERCPQPTTFTLYHTSQRAMFLQLAHVKLFCIQVPVGAVLQRQPLQEQWKVY